MRRDLRSMLGDGMAFSFMVGSGESYLPAFALALGLGDVTAGLIATLPMLAGGLLQLVTPWVVQRLRSHRRWVVGCALLQAASFLPLIVGAVQEWLPTAALFFTASLYWGFGMATGPAWNTWASTIVPRRLRARYFAHRVRWSQGSLMIGLAAAGWWLGHEADEGASAFALLFLAAMLARIVSVWMLARQSEPQPVPIGDTRISLGALRADLASGDHARVLLYLMLFQLAVWVAAPFFTPFMLGPVGLSYVEFMALTALAFGARVAVMPLLGGFAHRYGTRRLLWLGSVGIVPLPLLWLVSYDIAWLAFLQVLGGIAWGAFELATLLSFFDQIPSQRRTALLSVFNAATALAIVVGSLLGGVVLDTFGPAGIGYTVLLVGSALLRAGMLPLLRRTGNVYPPAAPPLRTLSVRPVTGGLQRPVLPGLVDEAGEGARPASDGPIRA